MENAQPAALQDGANTLPLAPPSSSAESSAAAVAAVLSSLENSHHHPRQDDLVPEERVHKRARTESALLESMNNTMSAMFSLLQQVAQQQAILHRLLISGSVAAAAAGIAAGSAAGGGGIDQKEEMNPQLRRVIADLLAVHPYVKISKTAPLMALLDKLFPGIESTMVSREVINHRFHIAEKIRKTTSPADYISGVEIDAEFEAKFNSVWGDQSSMSLPAQIAFTKAISRGGTDKQKKEAFYSELKKIQEDIKGGSKPTWVKNAEMCGYAAFDPKALNTMVLRLLQDFTEKKRMM